MVVFYIQYLTLGRTPPLRCVVVADRAGRGSGKRLLTFVPRGARRCRTIDSGRPSVEHPCFGPGRRSVPEWHDRPCLSARTAVGERDHPVERHAWSTRQRWTR
jgi:hypothetical protein